MRMPYYIKPDKEEYSKYTKRIISDIKNDNHQFYEAIYKSQIENPIQLINYFMQLIVVYYW